MIPLHANDIRGNWATLILPWTNEDTLDSNRLAEQIDRLIAFGVDGIYANGTAGEFHALRENEFDGIAELLSARCEDSGTPFQIGVSHMSAQISLDRLRRAVRHAPGALQVILPDWAPLNDEEVLCFLTTMANEAEGIGLILYNPPHAKRLLGPDDFRTLADAVPTLIGIKVAGGDEAWYDSMKPLASRLSIFVPGHTLATGFTRGAHGAYSNVACLHPGAAQRWWNQMQTDISGALEVEERIRAFIAGNILPLIERDGYSNAACDRLLARIGGWCDAGSRMRWPYKPIPDTEAARLRDVACALLPEFVG